jgi:catechol 2,3-dioxygenase-like lactoylglutathione lyase family enzyme
MQSLSLWAAMVVVTLSFVQSAKASATPHVGCPDVPVHELDRSVLFYTSVLEFNLQSTKNTSATAWVEPGLTRTASARTAHLTLGEECLDLTQYGSPQGKAFPMDSHADDLWFQHIAIVVSDMHAAYLRLRVANVQSVSNEPQVLPITNKAASGIAAFYFRDPDGHYLELIYFPPGKGQSKWQQPAHGLFLGIDHTAIAVSDMQRSLHFYRDELGLHEVGESNNVGPEQEHLSGVFNAHVLIAGLRGASGIGIELLCYVTPSDGRAIPSGQQPDDLAEWQTPIQLEADSIRALRGTRWTALPSPSETGLEAAWIKDPDGHLLELLKP